MRRVLNRFAAGFAAACLLGGGLAVLAVASPAYAQDSSSTTTTPASSSIVLGSSNSDSAVVQGDSSFGSPTGTVTFYECGPTQSETPCTSQANQVGSPVGVTAGDNDTSTASSASFTPDATGWWCFAGVYSGDSNYGGSSDATLDECFQVTAAASSTTTTPESSTIVLGNSNSDSALVTGVAGGVAPTGTVTFYECGPSQSETGCTSQNNQVGSAVNVTTGGSDTSTASSASFTPNATGWWCFAAVYSGDSNYTTSSDTTTDECFQVSAASSSTTTTPANSTIVLGNSDSDSALITGVAGGPAPTGTVSFYVCGPTAASAGCTSQNTQVGTTVNVTTGNSDTSSASSASFTPSSTGYWCFSGVYSGDSNYGGSSDTTTDECVDVTAAASSTTTAPATPTVVFGGTDSDTDNATVTGNTAGGAPHGTVTFFYCYDEYVAAPCNTTGNKVGTGAVTLTPGVGDSSTATSAPLKVIDLGYYCFAAYYTPAVVSPNPYADYLMSNDTAVTECFDVVPPAPTITSFSPASGLVGSKVTIKGTNLENATSVTFGGNVSATKILSDGNNSIKVDVPTGAKSGYIHVTTAGGTAESSTKFKVTK
jgi:hypothetical protein